LLALLEPCPVIGSLATTTSAMPSAIPPDGSVPTGNRTTGAYRPDSVPPQSVSSTARARSYSHGTNFSISCSVSRR
jgi:hypothetical protein